MLLKAGYMLSFGNNDALADRLAPRLNNSDWATSSISIPQTGGSYSNNGRTASSMHGSMQSVPASPHMGYRGYLPPVSPSFAYQPWSNPPPLMAGGGGWGSSSYGGNMMSSLYTTPTQRNMNEMYSSSGETMARMPVIVATSKYNAH